MDNSEISPTYCVNLFSQVATETLGYLVPCCQFEGDIMKSEWTRFHLENTSAKEFFNSEPIKEMRRKASCGEKIDGCRKCYELESSGIKSMRQRDNQEQQETVGKVGTKEHQDVIYSFDFRAGNICNLGCVMCNPSTSSKLDSLFTEHGAKSFSPKFQTLNDLGPIYDFKGWSKNDELIEPLLEDIEQVTRLWLMGGEPLLNKSSFRLLDRLKDKGKDLELEISTNVTIMNDEILEKLKRFNTRIKCSIDGTGSVLNYIRYPADGSEIEANLIKIIESDIPFDVVYTVNVLNIFEIENFVYWLNGLGEKAGKSISLGLANIVIYPDYLDIRNLPSEVKVRATEELKALLSMQKGLRRVDFENGVYSVIDFLNQDGDFEVLKSGWKYLEKFDEVRGLNWKNIVPQLEPYFNDVR